MKTRSFQWERQDLYHTNKMQDNIQLSNKLVTPILSSKGTQGKGEKFMKVVGFSGTWKMSGNWLRLRQHMSQGMDGVASQA